MVINSERLNGRRAALCWCHMTQLDSRDPARTFKKFREGTHRLIEPARTLENLAPSLLDFGITRVADVTGMDCIGIPTVMVVRPNSRSVSVSQGKGGDLASAKVSGIMESIEQYHAEAIIKPLQLASLEELRKLGPVIDVEGLAGFLRHYEPSQRILWIAGRDLVTDLEVWVPFEAVHLDLRLPLPTGSGYFMSGSNGLASGNHLLEATNHGLCELIERDALSLFLQESAGFQRSRRLALETVDDPLCLALLAKYERAHIDVAVWDITSDLGIPSFLCWILEATDDSFRPVGLAQGSGCHPTRAVALSRALSEAAQSRLTRIVGSRDDIQPGELRELRGSEASDVYRAQMARPSGECRSFQSVPTYGFDTFEEDVSLLLTRLLAADVKQVVVVDLSRSEYPLHVVRVLAPGLEGAAYLPGYRPGRRAAARRARDELVASP
jgi:YcaO-like protein with predicted kinase domain